MTDRVERVPYRLPELRQAADAGGEAFYAEGERDVATLVGLGLVATTMGPAGEGKRMKSGQAAHFRGLGRLVVLRDNDEEGLDCAVQVAGMASRVLDDVRLVELPGIEALGPKADVTDWINAGHTADELRAAIEATPPFGRAAPDREPEPAEPEREPEDEEEETPEAAAPGEPELDEAALYGVLGDVVRAVEPYTEASVPALLFTALALAGCAMGPNPKFKVSGAWHHTALWVLLVGDTAVGKGQSWDALEEVFTQAAPPFMHGRIAGGFGSGEAFVDTCVGLLCDDDDPDAPPPDPRLLMKESELSGMFKVSSRKGDTLSERLRDAWDGKPLQARSRGHGHKVLLPPYVVGAVGHITPKGVAKHMPEESANDGAANRWLWVWTKDSKLLEDHGDNAELAPGRLDALAQRLASALDAGGRVHAMHRSPAAREVWNANLRRLRDGVGDGVMRGITARGRPQVLRLSMVYAALDGSEVIGTEHLGAALAAWSYVEQSVMKSFGPHGVVTAAVPKHWKLQTYEDLHRLEQALRKAGREGLSRKQQLAVFGRNKLGPEVDELRQELVRLGTAEEYPLKPARGGRTATMLRLVEGRR